MTDTNAVAARLREEHGDLLDAIGACADLVAARGPAKGWTDSEELQSSLERCLRSSGLLGPVLGALHTAVASAGGTLRASPVPAPPYLAVTSLGVVLRGTLTEGCRLVVTLRAFDVQRGAHTRYVRREDVAVEVERR